MIRGEVMMMTKMMVEAGRSSLSRRVDLRKRRFLRKANEGCCPDVVMLEGMPDAGEAGHIEMRAWTGHDEHGCVCEREGRREDQ
jgi:hypothetical protein